ncbi:MAG: hypothetical protein RIG82_05855 [Phycisphaeraceae bacterium]
MLKNTGKTEISGEGGAKSDAVGHEDPLRRLFVIVRLIERLTPAEREVVMAMLGVGQRISRHHAIEDEGVG